MKYIYVVLLVALVSCHAERQTLQGQAENRIELKNTDMGLLPDSDKTSYGTCSTGDEFVITPQNNADVYEMEAMGAATPCAKFGVPFFAVKYVSDIFWARILLLLGRIT